ncbi:hypothetical protein HRbin12_01634 [bacterium HR12]|nr:hypothetical protein HRbin12_01634 [bacterium HR12]
MMLARAGGADESAMTLVFASGIVMGWIAPGRLGETGSHRLQAEFVAADHASFYPRVTATATFVKEGS